MRNSCYYPALQWEALLVYQKPGKMPKMTREGRDYMSKCHTNVWEIPPVINQIEQFGHPAVSQAKIFEPFGGSGTTLVAAEKASRSAYVMEQHPAYCDLIIKRWETLTGEKAVCINHEI